MTAPERRSARSASVVAARRLASRAGRREAGRFLVEGPQALTALLDHQPGSAREVYATQEAADRHAALLDRARTAGARVHVVADPVLQRLAETSTPQGLVAVADTVDRPLADVLATRPTLVAVLVRVRDPGNLGTVIRTADAAGADAVVTSRECADVHNGKAVRATAGSVFHLPLATETPVDGLVQALRDAGLGVLATDAGADLDLDRLAADGTLLRPTAWLFGNETQGLPAGVLTAADHRVRVPIYGRAESLNLAAAAAVCLYASAQARQRAGGAGGH